MTDDNFYLEGLVTCIEYSDYLKYFLDFNNEYFDNLIIITTQEDYNTIKLCNERHVRYIITDRIQQDGDMFNKGKAINDGIIKLNMYDWILIADSDIILPDNFRNIIKSMNLNKNKMYGMARHNCPSKEEWKKYLNSSDDKKIIVKKRWKKSKKHFRRYFSGYFQLFNINKFADNIESCRYPETFPTAGASDEEFCLKWDYDYRERINGMTVIHLSHGCKAANWCGRTSKNFEL